MSYTYEDAKRDAYLEEQYNQFGPEGAEVHAPDLNVQAVQPFTERRLQS